MEGAVSGGTAGRRGTAGRWHGQLGSRLRPRTRTPSPPPCSLTVTHSQVLNHHHRIYAYKVLRGEDHRGQLVPLEEAAHKVEGVALVEGCSGGADREIKGAACGARMSSHADACLPHRPAQDTNPPVLHASPTPATPAPTSSHSARNQGLSASADCVR